MRPLEGREEKHKTGSGTKSSRTICPQIGGYLQEPSPNVLTKFEKNRILKLKLISI